MAALQKLVDKVGDIDKYALAKTGYDPKDPVKDYLSAEQMDALGLAIDAADRGSAFILGDQGGVGKGRVAAAMMAYAIDRGLIPVFVTRDDKLYAAMIEDLSDIGRDDLIPLFTDNGLNIQDHTGKTWKQLLSKKVLTHIRDTGEMPDGHHVIFTKYTQISSDVPAGYKHPAPAPRVPPNGLRMEALSRIASKALFILDESHLASGDSIVSKRLEPLLKAAPAAYYSSATFAKRPDSVGIYFRTTLSRAAPDMDELIAALRQGGVPLQQAVISMLSDDGLYMRRERDFGKATYHTHILKETTDRDIELADTYTSGIRKILTVANQIKDIADNINKIIKNQGKRMGAPRAPKLSSTNFSAVIHNMVSQYLLAIKAHGAAGRAIEHIKNGRRVVVAVQNTMQSPIEHLRGAGLPITFNGLLLRYLEQQRWLKSGPDVVYISDDKDPEFEGVSDDALVRQFISVQQDPETGQKVTVINEAPVAEYFRRQVSALFKRVGGEIRGLKLGDMPLSPIDYMRQTVEKAGIKTAEITGRTIGIDTDSQIYDIPPHEKSKRAQLGYMSAFNNGDVKFIVLNASGSTGISLHSSTKFKNQEQRALLIVQPHLDINEYIQTLWRIDRTGQVEQPYFEVIQTAIPAELRPAAVLDRKMASLNANTTSNAENELKGGDIDIFNQFGDEVVHNYLRADPHFVEMLGDRKIVDKQGNLVPFDALELESGQLVARVTGRVAILMTAEGEEFYRQVFDNYRALIKYLTDTGQNPFVTDTIDMKAEVLSSKTFTAGKAGGDSVFDSPSALEHIKAEFGRKPRKGEDVLVEADETKRKSNEVQIKWQRMADDWEQAEHDRRLALEVRNLNESQLDEAKDAGATPDEYVIEQGMLASWENRMREARNTIWNALQLLGDTVHLHNARGLDAMGAVVDVKLNEERPMTPSAHEFTVWVNTTQRQIRLAASQLATDIQRVERERFVEQYEESAERSNERYIISGNLLAAAVSISDKGIENARIVRYTGDNGEIKQGILLPANTTPQVLAGKEQVQDYKHFRELLDAGKAVINGNQSMQIAALFSPGRIEYEMKIKAGRATGQRYWGDRSLRGFMANGDFIQKGSYMVGRFQKQGVQGVYERLAELETPLYFWRPLDQTGNQAPPDTTALGAAAPRFARDYWSEDVKPFIQGAGATMHEVVDAAVHVLSPSYGVNTDVVDQVMKLLGERNQVAYVVDRTGEALEKMFASMPRPDLVTFIDRVKRGERQATPELDEAARFVRKVDSEAWQGAWDAAKAAGFKEPPVKWLENHYRVMWKKIPGSEDPAKQWIPGRGKRPLSGSKGMMKQHTLEDMSEGLDQGGVPFSYNPITNEKMALTDIWKYTTALKLWTWGKEHGQVSFVRGPFPKLPDGMSWLDDNIADVWFPADSGEGLIHGGKYAVENGFGRLLNNYLSRDLIRQARTGRTLLWIKNATTALELALSLFHGVFETGEAIGSNIGLGLSKIYNRGLLGKDAGAAMSGMMDLVKSVASPVHIATLGAAFRKAAGRPDEFWQSKEGKAFLKINPDARDLINYLFAGGWKPTEVEADWKNQSVRAFTDAVANLKAGGSSNYLGAGLRAFPAANEFLMTPLFDIYIPNLKIGQFVQEMREALRQEDLKYGQTGYYIDRRGHRYDRPSNAQLARKVWRLVEDRFGELNYDTLFWNNTFKSAMQLMFRSVTWKLGSVEAFGGAFAGQGKEFVNAFKERRAPELHRNMAWLLGVFLLTAALGAVIQKVFAGKDPKGLTDLVFPQIDPRDDKVRVSIPTYFKDLVHLVHSPTGYVKASLAGWIGRVADLLSNKDYYGVQIRNDDDPATKQALQMGRYAAQSILPFSIRGYKNLSQSQENTVRKSMALFGVNPAPRYIGQTAAEQQVEKYWKGQRTEEGTKPEQYEIQKGKREIVSKIRHGSSPDISGALARGTIKPADIPALYKRATMGQLASSIDKMPLAEAEKVFARANPTERAQLAAIIARKRANSLRRSGRTMYAGF